MGQEADSSEFAAGAVTTIAVPYGRNAGSRVVEFFTIEKLETDRWRIRATRTADLVDLTFELTGFEYIENSNRFRARGRAGRLEVSFPPQHIAETIRDKPVDRVSGDEDCPQARDWGYSKTRPARPSVLRFEILDKEKFAGTLSLAMLTNWDVLTPIVDDRAKASVTLDAMKQIGALFPPEQQDQETQSEQQGKDPDLSDIRTPELIERLERALYDSPDDVTNLELVCDLVLSPSELARWECSPDPADNGSRNEVIEAWSARLGGNGGESLRVIHSRYLASHRGEDPPPLPVFSQFDNGQDPLLALSLSNHWNIVAQTSIYGLPAMLKVVDRDSTSDDAEALDAPPPTVVRVDPAKVLYLKHHLEHYSTGPNGHSDVGIALARPFSASEVNLTALGAVMDIEWKGEPPNLLLRNLDGEGKLSGEDYDFKGFDLESLAYRSWLGRDSRVEAVEKGYLLPLGVRASLLTICERKIYADAGGHPVSYETRRKVIVIPGKDKRFPVPYQPYDGRAFPTRRIAMKTRITPDLVDIESLPGLPEGTAFWPRVAGVGSGTDASKPGVDFEFEWETEDALARGNLLFVLNSVVGRPEFMQKIAAAYNEASLPRRRAMFAGARQRYAKPREQGDTSFDTNHWVMRLDGRPGADGKEFFGMDGRLEGADQPPVFPRVETASINYQALDQMVGQTQGGIEVAYYKDYLSDGFGDDVDTLGRHRRRNPASNQAEIYLQVAKGDIGLDATSHEAPAGGVATPNAKLAAFSRKIGMVGGTKNKAAIAGEPYDFSAAKNGIFKPEEFFSDAKLLGIIDLGKLASKGFSVDREAIPKLEQVVEYGAGPFRDYVGDAARDVLRLIFETGTIRDDIAHAVDTIEKATGFELKVLAGKDLADAIEAITDRNDPKLKNALEELERDPSVTNVRKVAELVEKIGGNVADFIEDPVPPLIKEGLARLADILEAFRKGALAEELRNYLVGEMRKAAKASFCAAIDDSVLKFGPIFFGEYAFDEDGNPKDCEAILRRPAPAFAAMRDNLFGKAFVALVDAAWPYLLDIADFHAEIEAYLAELDSRIEEAIRQALFAASDLLEKFDPNLADDLRQADRQQELLDDLHDAIADAVNKAFQSIQPARSNDPFPEFALAIDQFEGKAEAAIEKAIRDRAGLLPVSNQAKKEKAIARIRNVVSRELVEEPVTMPLRGHLAALRVVAGNGARSMLRNVEEISRALIEMFENSALAKVAGGITDLRDKVTTGALAILERGAAPVETLEQESQELRSAADALKKQSNPWELRQLGARALKAADKLDGWIVDYTSTLTEARSAVTAGGRDFLDPLGTLVRLRGKMLAELREVLAFAVPAPNSLSEAVPEAQTAGLVTALKALFKALAPAVHHGWTLEEIKAVVQRLEEDGTGELIAAQARSISALIGEIDTSRKTVADALGQVSSLAELEAVAREQVVPLVALVDGRVAAKLLQLTELPKVVIDGLKGEAGRAVMNLWQAATQDAPIQVFAAFEKAVGEIEKQLGSLDGDLRKIIAFVIGGKDKLDDLKNAFDKVGETAGKLAALGTETQIDRLIAQFKSLFDRDSADSVQRTFGMFTDALAAIRVVDAGQAITRALSELLRMVEAQLLALAKQFVPTKLTTTYEWKTDIGLFPASEEAAVFIPYRLAKKTDDPPKDLHLKSEFSFDFIDNKLTSTVTGNIAKFNLRLLNSKFHMATITFDKCTFRSKNGSKPEFDIKISAVEMGPMLKFLEPLQRWLSPEGTGFYLTLLKEPPGIEAGYIYNAGLVQIGSLQFINVNFGVAAQLPFDGTEAQFVFRLGSRALPFMVANPPYGGGGYVELVADAKGPRSMTLSIFFGGVSAIRFGPLRAQGRIVAGLYVHSNANRSYLLMAYFEAVGSGNIACFSISVSLVVKLVQTSTGAMYGSSTFSFKFKLGFIKYKYRVTAHYKIKNGKQAQVVRLLGTGETGAQDATITVRLWDKARDWEKYRALVDTALLAETREVAA